MRPLRVVVPLAILLAVGIAVVALASRGPGDSRATGTTGATGATGATGPAGAVLRATPRTLGRVFAVATTGDVIELAAGRYRKFHGALKPGVVTLRAAPGARVTMAVDFNPAANITLDGLRITDLAIGDARSRNLTVRNSRFDGSQAVIRTGDLANADILLERNVHDGFDSCASCYEGRIDLVGHGSRPSGVTIRDSTFTGGNSDGIQNGGYGVQIIANTFSGIHQVDGPDGVHADAIQLFGSKGSVIRGNRMTDVADGIMAPDGTDHELIENNVIATDGYPYAITIGRDVGSVIRGNRLAGGACDYGLPCGTLRIARGKDGVASRGTVVVGNVLGALEAQDPAGLAVDRANVVTG